MRYIVILFIIIIFAVYCESYTKKPKSPRYRNSTNRRRQLSRFRKPSMYRDVLVDIGDDGIFVDFVSQSSKYVNTQVCGRTTLISHRIVNGNGAGVGEYPWLVSIHSWDLSIGCAGSIISDRWILTAAHCFKLKTGQMMGANSLSIRVGSIYNNKGTRYKISQLIVNSRYNNDGMENSDIALLKTDRPILVEHYGNINTVNGICLPLNLNEEPKSNQILVIGWGKTNEKNKYGTETLMEVALPLISDQRCAQIYENPMENHPNGYTIYKSQFCTHSQTKDACQGDSGGPAMTYTDRRAVLVGVVSFGVGCATKFPGVFTQVSYFLGWIAQNIRQ